MSVSAYGSYSIGGMNVVRLLCATKLLYEKNIYGNRVINTETKMMFRISKKLGLILDNLKLIY